MLLAPAQFSLASLLSALCVAILCLALTRKRRRKEIKLRVLLRAIFPRRLLRSASSKADVGFFLFNSFLATALFGWAILSYHLVSTTVNEALVSAFGARQPTSLSEFQCGRHPDGRAVPGLRARLLAGPLPQPQDPDPVGVPQGAPQAEVLSPLTNFRVHPVDTLVFYNILALIMGTPAAWCTIGSAPPTPHFTIANSNVLTLTFFFLIGHLQHSHFWIAFTGVWGRLFLSPAHHQIHHSTNPMHFDKNLGSCLGVWDWLFGTLHVPGKTREKLTFGVEPKSQDAHTVAGGLITPLYNAFSHIKPLLQPRRASARTPPRGAVSAD